MKITFKQYALSLYKSTKGLDDAEVQGALRNFVKILSSHHDLGLAPKIIREFQKLYNKKEGIIKVEVSGAFEAPDLLVKELEKIFDLKVELKKKQDPALIGGVRLQFDDTVVDGTIKRKLEILKNNLVKL